jgi:carboxyl-terminal processing protease
VSAWDKTVMSWKHLRDIYLNDENCYENSERFVACLISYYRTSNGEKMASADPQQKKVLSFILPADAPGREQQLENIQKSYQLKKTKKKNKKKGSERVVEVQLELKKTGALVGRDYIEWVKDTFTIWRYFLSLWQLASASPEQLKEWKKEIRFRQILDHHQKEAKKRGEKLDADLASLYISAYASAMSYDHSYVVSQNLHTNRVDKIKESKPMIGLYYREREGFLEVTDVMDQSPATDGGFRPYDHIIKIAGEKVQGPQGRGKNKKKGLSDYVKEGKEITFEVAREGEILHIRVTPQYYTKRIVDFRLYYIEGQEFFWIKIKSFSHPNVVNEIVQALSYIYRRPHLTIILDLRGNAGGLVDNAFKVADLFLDEGKKVYSIKNLNHQEFDYTIPQKNEEKVMMTKDSAFFAWPIVLLLNESTASSAEILAAALLDNQRAYSVGRKTYGKGSVQFQEKYQFDKNIYFYQTKARLYRPNGNSVHGVGITPDIIVGNQTALRLIDVSLFPVPSDIRTTEEDRLPYSVKKCMREDSFVKRWWLKRSTDRWREDLDLLTAFQLARCNVQ